jgi:hypothetical protein
MQAQYPTAAGVLGDSIAALPPEKVAALEAFFDQQGGPVGRPMIDPNAARRAPAGAPGSVNGQKPLNEKTKDELLSDLRRLAPAYQEALKEGTVS